MLELSKAVQRVIDVERNANKDLRKELAAVKAATAAKVRHAQLPYLCSCCPQLPPFKYSFCLIFPCHAVSAYEGLLELRQECLTFLRHV